MGRYLACWTHHRKLLSSIIWRYLPNEGSTCVQHPAAGSWVAESVCKDSFSGHRAVTGGTHEQKAGFSCGDASGALGEACEVCLDDPQSEFEQVGRKYDKMSRHQSDRDIFRVALSCSNPVYLGTEYQTLSRFPRNMHTSSFDYFAENCTAQIDIVKPSNIHESKRAQQSLPHPLAVKNIIAVLGRNGWEGALEQLNVKLTTQVVCEVIRRQPNAKAAFVFFQWTKEQQGFQHTGRTYKAILQKLMSHRDFISRNLDAFQLIMNDSLHNGWSPGVRIHTYLVDGYCKLGKVDAALDHFSEMISHGCAPNVVTYSCLICGLIKAGRSEDALRLLDEMEENKCHPNVVTYSALINGLVKRCQLEEACRLFDRMKKQGCTPNLITYSCLIDGAARAGKFEEVSKLLNQMRDTHCIPSIFIYATLIKYLAKIGKREQAWDLFIEMKQHGLVPNLFVYTPLLASLGKAGNWELAQDLLKEMKSRGCPPDVVAYSCLIAGLVKADKLEEASLVLDHMEANGCDPNEVTCTILIDGLVRGRQAEKACALYKKMVTRGYTPPIHTQASLRKVLAKIGAQ